MNLKVLRLIVPLVALSSVSACASQNNESTAAKTFDKFEFSVFMSGDESVPANKFSNVMINGFEKMCAKSPNPHIKTYIQNLRGYQSRVEFKKLIKRQKQIHLRVKLEQLLQIRQQQQRYQLRIKMLQLLQKQKLEKLKLQSLKLADKTVQ